MERRNKISDDYIYDPGEGTSSGATVPGYNITSITDYSKVEVVGTYVIDPESGELKPTQPDVMMSDRMPHEDSDVSMSTSQELPDPELQLLPLQGHTSSDATTVMLSPVPHQVTDTEDDSCDKTTPSRRNRSGV